MISKKDAAALRRLALGYQALHFNLLLFLKKPGITGCFKLHNIIYFARPQLLFLSVNFHLSQPSPSGEG
jgi:hypothetical protein